jgi:hypothetical protein
MANLPLVKYGNQTIPSVLLSNQTLCTFRTLTKGGVKKQQLGLGHLVQQNLNGSSISVGLFYFYFSLFYYSSYAKSTFHDSNLCIVNDWKK